MKFKFKHMLIIITMVSSVFAQTSDSPLKIFGYFQNEFEYQKATADIDEFDQNTFVLQQLNLFFQKDFSFLMSGDLFISLMDIFCWINR